MGDLVYTSYVHNAWIRIYSRMLSLMVPLAVKFEMTSSGINQDERIKEEKASLSLHLDRLSACASPAVLSPSISSNCLSPMSDSELQIVSIRNECA